jgi:hypothetical protein
MCGIGTETILIDFSKSKPMVFHKNYENTKKLEKKINKYLKNT